MNFFWIIFKDFLRKNKEIKLANGNNFLDSKGCVPIESRQELGKEYKNKGIWASYIFNNYKEISKKMDTNTLKLFEEYAKLNHSFGNFIESSSDGKGNSINKLINY